VINYRTDSESEARNSKHTMKAAEAQAKAAERQAKAAKEAAKAQKKMADGQAKAVKAEAAAAKAEAARIAKLATAEQANLATQSRIATERHQAEMAALQAQGEREAAEEERQAAEDHTRWLAMQPVTCRHCQAVSPAQTQFCPNCGSKDVAYVGALAS